MPDSVWRSVVAMQRKYAREVRAAVLALVSLVLATPAAGATRPAGRVVFLDRGTLRVADLATGSSLVVARHVTGAVGLSGDGRFASVVGRIVGGPTFRSARLVWAPSGETAAYQTHAGAVFTWSPSTGWPGRSPANSDRWSRRWPATDGRSGGAGSRRRLPPTASRSSRTGDTSSTRSSTPTTSRSAGATSPWRPATTATRCTASGSSSTAATCHVTGRAPGSRPRACRTAGSSPLRAPTRRRRGSATSTARSGSSFPRGGG